MSWALLREKSWARLGTRQKGHSDWFLERYKFVKRTADMHGGSRVLSHSVLFSRKILKLFWATIFVAIQIEIYYSVRSTSFSFD